MRCTRPLVCGSVVEREPRTFCRRECVPHGQVEPFVKPPAFGAKIDLYYIPQRFDHCDSQVQAVAVHLWPVPAYELICTTTTTGVLLLLG